VSVVAFNGRRLYAGLMLDYRYLSSCFVLSLGCS